MFVLRYLGITSTKKNYLPIYSSPPYPGHHGQGPQAHPISSVVSTTSSHSSPPFPLYSLSLSFRFVFGLRTTFPYLHLTSIHPFHHPPTLHSLHVSTPTQYIPLHLFCHIHSNTKLSSLSVDHVSLHATPYTFPRYRYLPWPQRQLLSLKQCPRLLIGMTHIPTANQHPLISNIHQLPKQIYRC